jgi:phospholipid/cholesterol/gamma-HCH transport system substrate-binding protein
MGNNIVETLIGTFVLVLAGTFLTYAYYTADLKGVQDGYKITAKFDRVDGLEVGSDVRLSGIKVGSVTKQSLDSDTFLAQIELTIETDFLLPEDTSAKVVSDGLLGGSYITLEPGGSMDMLDDGGEITFTQGSIDLMGLIGQAVFSAGGSGGQD